MSENRRKLDEQKAIWNEITKEWLDEKFAKFGRFTFNAILAFLFVLIIRAIITMNANELRGVIESASQIQSSAQ